MLGFGGRATPLLFSRAASWATRSAQAELGTPLEPADNLARASLQLYVDDPALALAGDRRARRKAVDICLRFWTALGIPLSWRKGSITRPHADPFVRIGVR